MHRILTEHLWGGFFPPFLTIKFPATVPSLRLDSLHKNLLLLRHAFFPLNLLTGQKRRIVFGRAPK